MHSGHRDEDARARLRIKGQIRYCLFDFDLSQIFSPDASINDCFSPIASVKERGPPDLHPKDIDCVGRWIRLNLILPVWAIC
jgi:hypothetical protein